MWQAKKSSFLVGKKSVCNRPLSIGGIILLAYAFTGSRLIPCVRLLGATIHSVPQVVGPRSATMELQICPMQIGL